MLENSSIGTCPFSTQAKKPAPEWYARIDQVRMGDGVIKGPACLPSAVQAELHLC